MGFLPPDSKIPITPVDSMGSQIPIGVVLNQHLVQPASTDEESVSQIPIRKAALSPEDLIESMLWKELEYFSTLPFERLGRLHERLNSITR
jgi:hypothetical protein